MKDAILSEWHSNDVLWIICAVLIGLAIGFEREYQNKSAGLRTFILISTGSCIFTILSTRIGLQSPDRIASNIITGIGFIGAGVIFKEDNKVSGITTAATIWATASLGMCMGSGHLFLGFMGGAIVLVVLRGLLLLQNWIDSIHKILVYTITTHSEMEENHAENYFLQCGIKSEILSQSFLQESRTTKWKLTGKASQHTVLQKMLVKDKAIISFQYL